MDIAKNAKRKEAVERLRKGESNNIEWMILGDDCPSWVNYDTLSYNKAVRERIADLFEDETTELTVYNEASDDELFRCSYCHCKVYNIDMTEGDCGWGFTFCPQCGGEVYESDSRKIEAKLDEPTNVTDGETNGIGDEITLPDGDAVVMLRKYANFWSLSHETHTQCDSDWEKTTMRALADMVERDYVKLSEYERATRDAQELYLQVEAECDKWKSECSKLTDKIGEITDEGSELMKKQPYTFDVHDVPGSLQTVGRYIDELTAERDELREKLDDDWRYVSLKKSVELLKGKVEDLLHENTQLHAQCYERDGVTATAKIQALLRENANLAHDLAESNVRGEKYRALVGQMLDATHEMRRIADANMPEGAVV